MKISIRTKLIAVGFIGLLVVLLSVPQNLKAMDNDDESTWNTTPVSNSAKTEEASNAADSEVSEDEGLELAPATESAVIPEEDDEVSLADEE